MFKTCESRLSVSDRVLLAAADFRFTVDLASEVRTSTVGFEGLKQAFERVEGFVAGLALLTPGIRVAGAEGTKPPPPRRVSRCGCSAAASATSSPSSSPVRSHWTWDSGRASSSLP